MLTIDDKRFVWNNGALEALFELWQDYQPGFKGVRKNSYIYKEIADKLKELGPTYTEVKNKIDSMTNKYREDTIYMHFYDYINRNSKLRSELAKVVASGGRPSLWEHYGRVSFILHTGNTEDRTPIDTTDLSTIFEGSNSTSSSISELSNSIEQEETSGPHGKKRRRDIMGELVEVEKKKLAVMEKMAADSAAFHKHILEFLQNRNRN